MRKKYNSLILFGIVFGLKFVSSLPIFAAQSANTAVNVDYPAFLNSSSSIPSFISGLYDYAIGISGTLAIIMIIYGGIKYLASGGNESALGDAKDRVTNAIWGLLLLAGSYLVLNTINPQLVSLNFTSQSVPAMPTSGGAGEPGGTQEQRSTLSQIASSILSKSPGEVAFSKSADCSAGTDASSIINDVSNGVMPFVCSPSCSCSRGGTSGNVNLSINMLETLDSLVCGPYSQGTVDLGTGLAPQSTGCVSPTPTPFMVTSLTGGKHATNSYHYQGRAMDIVVTSSNDPNVWNSFVKTLTQNGASFAKCEISGTFYDDCSSVFNGNQRKSGAHIHAQW